MAPISPGKRVGPPRKAPKQTQTEKAHRYEPFTKRVARLKIDPVHKVQQSRLKETSDDISQSYFRAALEEWSELNLTSTFTSFYYQVNSLCESLPQLLHHADRIADSLLDHIEKQDSLALESLLSLVAHLAHDLGQEFEKYFARTVKLVAKVSTAQDDPAVVESCFTCLAWIYKYLSRLLVQDLRPLLDVLLPYFSARKEYIRRFTAESLAFLIRKAAVLYPRNPKPLTIAVKHVLQAGPQNLDSRDTDSFVMSSMTLLAESAAGVDATLHSSAPELFKCVYDQVSSAAQIDFLGMRILQGVTVNLVHKTDTMGFKPILDTIMESLAKPKQSLHEQAICSRLLLVAVATRGGTRIDRWTPILQMLPYKMQEASQNSELSKSRTSTYIKTMVAALQYAPLNELLPHISELVNAVISNTSPAQFFTFCEAVAHLGKPRFQDILLSHLQQYIVSHWARDEQGLVVLLNDLNRLDCVQTRGGKTGHLSISDSWEASLRQRWQHIQRDQDSFPQEQKELLLVRSVQFPKSADASDDYVKLLHRSLTRAIDQESQFEHPESRVALGWGLQTLLSLSGSATAIDGKQYTQMVTQHENLLCVLPFVQVLSNLPTFSGRVVIEQAARDTLCNALMKNMLNSSRELRKASLQLLKNIESEEALEWLTTASDLLCEILDTAYSITNARQISMLVRRLPQTHKKAPTTALVSSLIPTFALGLLPDYHDKLRKEVSSALSQMMTTSSMEDVVLEVMKEWLHAPNEPSLSVIASQDNVPDRVSPFECTRLSAVESAFDSSSGHFVNPIQIISDRVGSAHALLTLRTPANGRSIALQVLNDIPQTAEKRSKILIPAFLAAQRGRAGHDLSHIDETHSVNTLSPDIEVHGWSLKERKLFLQLIAQFNNPRMLYRADDVHVILLELLTNGDADTRKLALVALLKWKDKALLTHQDALTRVAEDKTTTTEIALMLSSDNESRTITGESRLDVLPVLLRLIFGQLVGRAGIHGSQEAKRKSLLRLLFRMERTEILMFLDISLGQLRQILVADAQDMQKSFLVQDLISQDQQYGFLRMVSSMLEILQNQFSPFGSRIIDAVLYCTTRASYQINALEESERTPALLRNVRRTGLHCLNLIFEYCPELDLEPYRELMWSELINPRLLKFVPENTEGVSTLLKMFSIWARSESRLPLLVNRGGSILHSCWSLLGFENTKPVVKTFLLEEVTGPILDVAEHNINDGGIAREITIAHSPQIMDSIGAVLAHTPPKDLLLAATKIVQRLQNHVEDVGMKQKVVELLVKILDEPNQRLPPHIKGQVLKAIKGLGEAANMLKGASFTERLFELLSSYFDFFRDVPNRETCSYILKLMARDEQNLKAVADICEDLNAFSTSSLDEVDFDRQSSAFTKIHSLLQDEQVDHAFLPVLHNLIFLIRTTDDTATRGSALSCVKHIVSALAKDLEALQPLPSVLLAAIRKHLRDDSETVRADFAEMLGAVVKEWKTDQRLQNMRSLLVGDDEEASFFANILHIQLHRRTRAMRRLTTEVEDGAISAENISDYFLPLLQKFADDDGTSDSAQATKGQSIASMTVLLQWLDWKSFRTVFRRYRQSLDQRKDDGKLDVRLLNHAADALGAAIDKRTAAEGDAAAFPHLVKSLPAMEVIADELKNNFIPKLAELSHYRDEGEISQRIPAAVVAVKLIKLLPEDQVSLLAAPIVLDIAQVLRSRTQETRDLARNKLAETVVLLGSSSLQFVLKELRTALTRGYQLHVLSYTLHTILLATAEQRSVGDLDYCLDDLVKVILDDIFGAVGQEKDNQDYISSMKEVKSNKSFDSMEILAKCTSVKSLAKLILPFQALLAGTLTPKQARYVDELFRRTGVGISHSPSASTQDLLIFAFELIHSFYRVKAVHPQRPLTNDEKNRDRFIVQKDNTSKVGRVTSASLSYKLAKFAIDIARSTFARHSELLTPSNVHGFLGIIGDALVEAQEDVKISALRLLSTVIKLDMPQFEENAKLYIMEAVKVVKSAISTNEEAAQAALKVAATILREKRDVEVRESDVAYMLKRTMPDLEEPDRQGVTFNFVKAVMARQMQMPEMYELVDKIGLMMVTSQSRSSREAARGVYVHFLLDYPQGKARWSKQIKFLVKNLEYQYPEGRQSVMEASNTLLAKIDKGTAQELTAVMFIPIVLRMANDDNVQCRELAGALLTQLFRRTTSNGLTSMLEPLRAWLEQEDNVLLRKISLQAWTIYFAASEGNAQQEVILTRENLMSILGSAGDDLDWEVKYHAMELASVLVKEYPQAMLTAKQEQLWNSFISTLASPQPWLQSSASNLIGLFFRDCINAGRTAIPLASSMGLNFDEMTIITLLRSSLRVLKHQSTSQELAQKVVQNILFLGRCVDSSGTCVSVKKSSAEIEDDESQDDIADDVTNAEANNNPLQSNGSSSSSIPATQYILDQASRVLRREPAKQTSAALQPKIAYLALITNLTPHLSISSLKSSTQSITNLLIPLLHLTSTTTAVPRSTDSTFSDTYTSLIESAQVCLEAIQAALGDQSYMRCVSAASKIAREKRQERRTKRAIDTIAEPERAAKEKRRKFERKKERRKEVKGIHRGNRRKDLGF